MTGEHKTPAANEAPAAEYDTYTPPATRQSSMRKLMFNSHDMVLRFSDWIVAWTPALLVVTYFIASTAIYTSCSTEAIQVFYFFYMAVNFYIACCTVVEAFLGMSPLRQSRAAALKVQQNGGVFPSADADLPIMDLVIVAYLPNEQDIVKDQVLYALEELAYPQDKLRINLVYNTPKPIEPLESELHAMEKLYPQLRVIKVVGSKSKADNLNYFFQLETGADIIGIFDCDHFPHPHNPRWAAERFLSDKKVDIVQGRCVVYNTGESWLTRLIAIEFDKIYAVSHPGRQRLFGFGLFCGSNGYWKADLLRGHKMHGHMLCEDIDSALRAYGEGKNAVHDMNVVSYEMAPTEWDAFWKQRMRWAQGWTQASIRHMNLIWNNPPGGKRTFKERYGCFSLLFVREISYYLVTQHTCLMLSFVIIDWPKNPTELVRLIFFRYPMAEWFLFSTVLCLIFTLYVTQKARSEYSTFFMMIYFSTVYTFYLILMATMGLWAHGRQIVGYSSWNPTARGGKK